MELRHWLVPGNVKKQQNKLVERKAFVDTVRIKSADLKNKQFLFYSFAALKFELSKSSFVLGSYPL